MLIDKTLATYFTSKIRKRGEEYFSLGLVNIDERYSYGVVATVSGTDDYKVTINLIEENISFDCTCPYFEDAGPCKHLWATILEIGRANAQNANNIIPLPLGEIRNKQQVLWNQHFHDLSSQMKRSSSTNNNRWPQEREIIYVIDIGENTQRHKEGLVVLIGWRQKKKNGQWSKLKTQKITPEHVAGMSNQSDRRILSLLMGAKDSSSSYYYYYDDRTVSPYVNLSEPAQIDLIIPMMCDTGRCFLCRTENDLRPVVWDNKQWQFWLDIAPDETGNNYIIKGMLCNEDERININEPVIFTQSNMAIWQEGRIARFNDFGAQGWIELFQKNPEIIVPAEEKDKLLEELFDIPRLPEINLPDELKYEKINITPKPRLQIWQPDKNNFNNYCPDHLVAELSFDYNKEIITSADNRNHIFLKNKGKKSQLIIRDNEFEISSLNLIKQLGFIYIYDYLSREQRLRISPKKFPKVVPELLAMGFHIEAEGKLYHQPGSFTMKVKSDIDWFELHGSIEFGDQKAALPQLLSALKKGENMVVLGDGSFGILPEDWLKKYGLVTGMGEKHDDHIRFSKSQVGILDALLATQPEANFDEAFKQAREQLMLFDGIKQVAQPAGFKGKLRSYQNEGLGWFEFLQQFGFGGCLADDMGLGKTVQVLALLEIRRQQNQKTQSKQIKKKNSKIYPSLVVVPKSLVFNWQQEAARFTPQLKILDHSSVSRLKPGEHFKEYDLIITTYGVLRRDAVHLKDIKFDYCVLDEAQAIKNSKTSTAKAVRLINSGHRLALSGTPIENHLGELWSLFEFLNPGLLGASPKFQSNSALLKNPDEETRVMLTRGLRPFILRRTKDKVAKDLPPKTEQTLFCKLEGAQKRLYKELLGYYRSSLLKRVKQDGINKSKIYVLEALLRLRQAACHPGLIDNSRIDEGSAKIDTLISQLLEVIEEGHKALVFSQFTSFLSIIRRRLDSHGITYEYLDGKTRDRAARVEQFQNNPDCPLFLISLKAGGLGLNLTAAEYVFLLDPWWNPAVEAQAIDRTHRIGQNKHVFAYRLIAKDTIEEKVLELQKQKRDLADAIINADNSLLRDLSREDLELLLS